MSQIEQNTVSLQDLLETINALSGSDGMVLPEVTNPAAASDIFTGKEALSGAGAKLTGTNPYNAANVDLAVENALTELAKKGVPVNGSEELGDLASLIGSIQINGAIINNQNKTLTANGVYTADAGYTGLGMVTVNVESAADTSAEDGFVTGELTEYRNDRVTYINSYAFATMHSLAMVSVPTVDMVGMAAFYACPGLTTVDMPSARVIHTEAFYNCTALERLDLPSISTIFDEVFYRCSSLTTLILRRTSVSTLRHTNALASTPIASGEGYIYVPDSLVDSYKAATNWSTYASQIKPISELPV